MIYLIQNTEIYNNDIRVMLQAFYPSHKIINHDSLARTPDLLDTAKQEVFMTFAFRCDETGIDMKVYDGFVPEEIPGDTIDRRDIPELYRKPGTNRIKISDLRLSWHVIIQTGKR